MIDKRMKSLKKRVELLGQSIYWTSRNINRSMSKEDWSEVLTRLQQEQAVLYKLEREVSSITEDLWNER